MVSIPDSVSVWLAAGTGSVPVSASVQLSGTDLTNPKIDVIVLTDFFVDSTSATGQRGSIYSSWSSVASDFASLKLDAKFAVVNFLPSSNTTNAGYSLRSDYTLATASTNMVDAGYHFIGCGSTAGAQLKRGQNIINAINDIATSRALNWRSDSYHVVWVHTLCPLPADASSSISGVNLKTIQQTTGIVPVIANGQQPQSSSLSFTSNMPYNYTAYYSGINATWDSPFRSSDPVQADAFPAYRGMSLFSELVKTVQVVASQGDVAWLTDIPATYTTLSSSGLATIAYNLVWPANVPANPVKTFFETSVQILGRDAISYLIYFNRPPTLAPYVGTIGATSTSLTIVMTPSDIGQGYLLALQLLTLPSSGTLTFLNGTSLLADSTLDPGSHTLRYTPTASRSSDFVDSFTMSVSDGCKTSTISTASISVSRYNRPPSAASITIYITEDVFVSDPFSLTVSDPDGDNVTAFLPSLSYCSGTLSVGQLGSGSPSNTTYYTYGAIPSTELYYHLIPNSKGLTGNGFIKVPYQAFDGSLYSSLAFITIQITHVNHAPVIFTTDSVANYGQTANLTISVYDDDASYTSETALIQIIGTTDWGTGSPASDVAFVITNQIGALAYTFSGNGPFPFQFSILTLYANNYVDHVRTGNTMTFIGFTWTAPASAPVHSTQTLKLRVIDQSGAIGLINLNLKAIAPQPVGSNNPPVWVQTPGVVAEIKPPGSTWDGIYFSANDPDGMDAMNALSFLMTGPPAHGTAYLQASNGETDSSALLPSYSYSASNSSPYIAYNSSGIGFSDFRIRYVGNPGYVGTDSIYFTMTDSTGLTGPAVMVTFTTTRQLTPPISSNISITTYEGSTVAFYIPGQSTNDAYQPVYITLMSLNFAGVFRQFTGTGYVDWAAGSNSTIFLTNGGTTLGILTPNTSTVSLSSTVPAGTFTYRVWEPANSLYSPIYTGSIYVISINRAPTSTSTMNSNIRRDQLLSLRLPASDVYADGTDDQLSAAILSVSPYNGGPSLYYDSNLTIPIDSASIEAGKRLTDRTFYYKSSKLYDASVPLMTYQYKIYDQHNTSSAVYTGTINVTASNSLPQVPTNVTRTPLETTVPIQLSVGVVTESGQPPTVQITSLPAKGTFSYCDDTGVCTAFSDSTPTLPFTLPSAAGRVVYVPYGNESGAPFTSFAYTLTDPGTGTVGSYMMAIDVGDVTPSVCPPEDTRPSADFVCINGLWTATSTVSTPTLNIPFGAGTVVIMGNLTSPNVVFHGIGSTIVVNGSVGTTTTITLEFDSDQTSNLRGQKVLQILVNTSGSSSSSDLSLLNVNTKVTSGCRKVKAEKATFDGGKTLGAYMTVDRSGCNTWWIILVSVVVVVIVLAAAAVVLLAVFYKPFREKIRPYSAARANRASVKS